MALLPHPCLPFFSFAAHGKPPHITPRPSNFHLSPFPINPPAFRRFGKHHRLVVSQHSSPTAFTDSSSEKPTVVRRQSSYRPPMWDSRFMESLNEGHLVVERIGPWRKASLCSRPCDRVLFVGMELNFLPEFSNGRIMLGKLANLMAVMDGTYDTYGTLEEMELFTDAINRWDSEAMDQLPEYLRLLYHALYKLVNEGNYMSTKHRENNGIYYIKKMFEENGGDVTKSIECYMIEHGVSREVANTHIKNLIAKAWKDINQELLNPIPLPKPAVDGIINYAKASEVFYLNGNDGFGNSQSWFKDTVDFILFEPIPL